MLFRSSEEVAGAIRATGLVNGPVVTIPNGVDIAVRPRPPGPRGTRLLVAGWKEPEWTRTVATALRGLGEDPVVIDAAVDRGTFLARLGDADTTVLLPLPREGCFLPALEAFASGCVVVCRFCCVQREGLGLPRPAAVEASLRAVPPVDRPVGAVRALP